MRRTTMALLLVVSSTFVASVLVADSHGDKAAITAQIEEMWKKAAEKKYDAAWIHPKGATQATSAGGFWESLSAEELVAQINEGPNKLDFTPHYIKVKLMGSNKDVAFVTFYLTGTITRPSGEAITNYRTRGSIVMEKVDGKWVESGSHYSPLFAGSGVVLD